ncbi:MAG: carboxypeptidase-like regulatory domain-containing protein [Planctomycetota bacterium]|nr:carboxypeptidase-like regulatory domain-containing protein [Planctomycetota bacterium]
MDRPARNVLLVCLVAAAIVGLGLAGWWILREAPGPVAVVDVGPAAGLPAPSAPAPEGENKRKLELAEDDAPAFQSLETTVIFPLEVEMKLLRAASNPKADGSPGLGAGATATLAGSVVDGKNGGVRAQVRFLAGPNRGRTLYADSLGRFGADGLYPGLSVVGISGPGIPGSQREVRLRPQRETQLNIGYARPARVYADVMDKDAKPIQGAVVTLDGQVAETGEEGFVEFGAVAAGEVLVVVEKAGFASLRQTLNLVGGNTLERGKIKFRLDPGASLQVSITDALNAGQQATLFILPEDIDGERKFPWQKVNPVRIWPGGTAIVEDLPEARVTLRLYHAGALSKPARRSVELHPGARETVEFGLQPAPVVTGVVTDGGTPAENAIVRLEPPDRTAAMLSVFGQSSYLFLESDVLPELPPALQEATTNGKGEYQLSASEDVSAVRYLTALSRDGKRVAHAVLKLGDVRADLALKPVENGAGELAIQMQDRIQPLPVQVTVEGVPRDPFVLPLGRDLRIANLPEGSWLVTVRWSDAVLTKDQPLEIAGDTRLFVALPEGAIVGQDAETRRRAGKR